MKMKHLGALIAALFVLAMFCIPVAAQAIDIPEQCKGKTVRCGEAAGTCQTIYCPKTTVYGPDGSVTTEGGCDACRFVRECWCDGYAWQDHYSAE